MKAALQLTSAVLVVLVLATSVSVFAEESCRGWSAASADPTKGRYALELRTCDLTYGLSAYVEIKNNSTTRVALAYRIFTSDDKHRDSEIILEPGATSRAENCQACAKRHSGFKSWEILTASEAPAEGAGVTSTTTAAPLPAFMEKAINANKPASPPATEVAKPVDKPVEKTVVEPVAAKPVVPVPVAPTVAEQPKTPKTESAVVVEPEKKQEEGFRAEDGTIIPWEKLPPEFRPRK